jgi:hypothetical protein
MIPSLDGGGGDAGAAGTTSSASTAAADAGAKGVDCITEPETGATICTGISTCPGLAVDHDVFPHCGFRPGGTVLDLECACGAALCPIGVATTCEQAKTFLGNQTEPGVCTQVAEDRCTTKSPNATNPSPATSAPSTCDKNCASDCAGSPGCLQLCGC